MHSRENVYQLLEDKGELIHLITKLLIDLLRETASVERLPSPFDCRQVPAISILDYLKRIAKYSRCSCCVFVAALIYIDRLNERIQNFIINNYNIHRLLMTSVMVAAKFLDDFYFKNQFYAKIGGISRDDINRLELEILKTMDFTLFIREEQFISYLDKIQSYKQINH